MRHALAASLAFALAACATAQNPRTSTPNVESTQRSRIIPHSNLKEYGITFEMPREAIPKSFYERAPRLLMAIDQINAEKTAGVPSRAFRCDGGHHAAFICEVWLDLSDKARGHLFPLTEVYRGKLPAEIKISVSPRWLPYGETAATVTAKLDDAREAYWFDMPSAPAEDK